MKIQQRVIAIVMTASMTTWAASIDGHVVGISDGDTLTLLTQEKKQIKVRLAEIDAPEKTQAFGVASKRSLSDLCFDKPAMLSVQDTDRYGRTVARVMCMGIDANAEQVRLGFAWVYDKYVKDLSLYELQANAKANSRGLWADAEPVPPWNFRRQVKQERK